MIRRWTTRVGLAALVVAVLGGAVTSPAGARPPARTISTAAVVINQDGGPARSPDAGRGAWDAPGSLGGPSAAETDFEFEVMRTSADRVVAHNIAYALTTCDGCTSAAVSVQILLSGRGADSLELDNQSLAFNVDCRDCMTTTLALQFVVADSGKLGLTGAGRSALAGIERDLRRALSEDPSPSALTAAGNVAAQRISAVLQTELKSKPMVAKRLRVTIGDG